MFGVLSVGVDLDIGELFWVVIMSFFVVGVGLSMSFDRWNLFISWSVVMLFVFNDLLFMLYFSFISCCKLVFFLKNVGGLVDGRICELKLMDIFRIKIKRIRTI